jgi:tRNA(fMet)-specific endonuclease VapC
VLDTDVCVEWLRRRRGIPARLKALSPADLAITAMTEAELRFGALRSRDPAGNLQQVEEILESGVGLLGFDRAAAQHHADIRQALKSEPIGERDLVIASIARSNGYRVATGNVREFARVPGLPVDNWLP